MNTFISRPSLHTALVWNILSLRLREVKILVLTGLAAAGRPSKIWTSKLRHIGIKSSSGSADLHKTKTICQQLIQIPLPAPTSLLLPSSRIYFRSAEQNPRTNPVVKILALLHFRIYFDPIVYEYLNTFLRIRWRTILIFTKLCL